MVKFNRPLRLALPRSTPPPPAAGEENEGGGGEERKRRRGEKRRRFSRRRKARAAGSRTGSAFRWTFYIRTDIRTMKGVSFLGDSLEAIRAFPEEARREAGFQIGRVQRGVERDQRITMSAI